MPAGGFCSLGSNLRLPKVFGGNGFRADAQPAPASSKGLQTGRCDWDVYCRQRQRKESDLKEVERIKELIAKLEQQPATHRRASSVMASSGNSGASSTRNHNLNKVQETSLDDNSDGLEARMRTEFVMIKNRLRKMEKELQQLGSTRIT